jgi:hypothetical protein
MRDFWFNLSPGKRALVALVGLSILLFVGTTVAQGGRRWLFSRDVEKAERRITELEAARNIAEGKALIAEAVLREKREQLAQALQRAEAAEAALIAARNVTVRTRVEYDQVRNRDLSVVSGDTAGLCAELARLGYPCVR